MSKGLIYVFTGEGKGKTSAALGVATRALLINEKAIWVAFYKEESWGMAEKGLRDKFENLEMMFIGRGFSIGKKTVPVGNKGHVVVDKASVEEHKIAARQGLELVAKRLQGSELTKSSEPTGKPFLIVMDEILNAVSEGLLGEKEVLDVLNKRGTTHLVLTGRSGPSGSLPEGIPEGILRMADLVTECKKIKHPYEKGELAVRGLDY